MESSFGRFYQRGMGTGGKGGGLLTRLAEKICAQSARPGGCHFQIVEQAAAAVVQRRIEATMESWNGTEAQGPRGLRRTTVGRGEPVKGPLQWRCSWSIMLRRGCWWEKRIQKVTTKAEARWWKWGT